MGGAEHGTGAAGGHGGGGEVLAMEIKDCMLNGDLPAAGLAIKCGCAYVNRSVDGAREMVANESRLPKTGTPPRWAVFLMLVVSMALWGGTWPVGRVVAASFSPWNAALLRFAMATAVLVPMCLRAEGRSALRVRRELLPRLLVLGATGIFGYSVLFFSGLRTTPAGRAALIVGCIPACIALGSCLLARRWARLPAIGGILLSLIGVAVVIANGNPLRLLSGTVQRGDLMILGCVLCWTGYTLCARPVMRELSPLVTVTWSCLFGSLLLLPFSLFGGLWGDITAARWGDWAGLAYLGVAATSFGYFWYYRAIQHVGPVASGVFINLVPLFAVFLGCLFLDEPLHSSQVVGGLMVIAGVVVAARAGGTS